MATYIHQLPEWPHFKWEQEALAKRLAAVRLRQGEFIGRMRTLGFQQQEEAVLETLTEDVLKSSEIEGEILDKDQVQSSIARRLGIESAALPPADRNVEGVVEMMLDATQKFKDELTSERLFGWHASLFPTGRSGMRKIAVGAWRDAKAGPMQVVSGAYGREKVHYEAPDAAKLDAEMNSYRTARSDFTACQPKSVLSGKPIMICLRQRRKATSTLHHGLSGSLIASTARLTVRKRHWPPSSRRLNSGRSMREPRSTSVSAIY